MAQEGSLTFFVSSVCARLDSSINPVVEYIGRPSYNFHGVNEVGMTRDRRSDCTDIAFAEGCSDIGECTTLATTRSKDVARVDFCASFEEINGTYTIQISSTIVVQIIIAKTVGIEIEIVFIVSIEHLSAGRNN